MMFCDCGSSGTFSLLHCRKTPLRQNHANKNACHHVSGKRKRIRHSEGIGTDKKKISNTNVQNHNLYNLHRIEKNTDQKL